MTPIRTRRPAPPSSRALRARVETLLRLSAKVLRNPGAPGSSAHRAAFHLEAKAGQCLAVLEARAQKGRRS